MLIVIEEFNLILNFTKVAQKVLPNYFSKPLTKIEKCSFEGLKSDVSPARIPGVESFRQIVEL
jgi:hypothetical protein